MLQHQLVPPKRTRHEDHGPGKWSRIRLRHSQGSATCLHGQHGQMALDESAPALALPAVAPSSERQHVALVRLPFLYVLISANSSTQPTTQTLCNLNFSISIYSVLLSQFFSSPTKFSLETFCSL